jgi:hypothetical protein
MVMRNEHESNDSIGIQMLHLGWNWRDRGHTAQDDAGIRIVHGRSTARNSRRSVLQRYNELGELDAIRIDEPLLTGNLDHDISILNIVA